MLENFAFTDINDKKYGWVSSDSVCPDMFILFEKYRYKGRISFPLNEWYEHRYQIKQYLEMFVN